MPNKRRDDPTKGLQQEIAEKKADCVKFYRRTGIKSAAADWVGRTLKTINDWERADEEFRYALLRARAEFLDTNRHKVKLDNVFAHHFDEYKPPKQEIEETLTLTDVKDPSALIALLATRGFGPVAGRRDTDQES